MKKLGCQKICKGPVTGLKVRGRMEWFARIDKAKPMVALSRGPVPTPSAQGRLGRPWSLTGWPDARDSAHADARNRSTTGIFVFDGGVGEATTV